jgi:hypothetical protein
VSEKIVHLFCYGPSCFSGIDLLIMPSTEAGLPDENHPVKWPATGWFYFFWRPKINWTGWSAGSFHPPKSGQYRMKMARFWINSSGATQLSTCWKSTARGMISQQQWRMNINHFAVEAHTYNVV